MEEEGSVSGEGWLSDDSSFYGGEEEQERLISLCQDFDPVHHLLNYHKSLNVLLKDVWSPSTDSNKSDSMNLSSYLAMEANPLETPSTTSGLPGLDRKAMEEERLERLSKKERAVSAEQPADDMARSAGKQRVSAIGKATASNVPTKNVPGHASNLSNIYEGQPNAWQLGETAKDFVSRMPPISTSRSDYAWIWCANPYPGGRLVVEPPRHDVLRTRGLTLLQQSANKRHNIKVLNSQQSRGHVSKLLNEETEDLKQRLGQLGAETNILSGKWMIFPKLENLTQTWIAVVNGTSSGRLGSNAKVATDDGNQGDRLICVYTKDFRDTEDVLRVLQELASMGLARGGRGIFYKSDVYTLLDIYGTNAADYGLQASIYSSQKMLASSNLAEANAAL